MQKYINQKDKFQKIKKNKDQTINAKNIKIKNKKKIANEKKIIRL